ncbi:hypothetical protein DOJK_01581 [Patescibacteria group bacterium]|nr:hypothetical protein DOJK_01581 [Patescibacteria group bacterium]
MKSLIEKINANPKAAILTAIIGVFVVSTAVILILIVSLDNSIKNPDSVVTPEEKRQVLSGIIKNNTKEAIKDPVTPNAPTNPTTGGNQATDPQVPVVPQPIPVEPVVPVAPDPKDLPIVPDLNEYNYRVTTTTTQKGPSSELCKAITLWHGGGYMTEDPSADFLKREYHDYFERYQSYSKGSVYEGEESNLSAFYINKWGRKEASYTDYLNGSYAVSNVYNPYPEYDALSDVRTTEDDNLSDYTIDDYFGENTEIINVTIDSKGNKIYTIVSTFQTHCSVNYNPHLKLPGIEPLVPSTIYIVRTVNEKGFEVTKTERYLDEINAQSLVDVTISETVRSLVDYENIKDVFELDSDVEIVTRDRRQLLPILNTYDELARQVNYLVNRNQNIILPVKDNTLASLYVADYRPENYEDFYYYLKDIEFYPDTEWGRFLFDRTMERFSYDSKIVYTATAYGLDGYYLYLDKFEDGVSADSVISEILGFQSTTTQVTDGLVSFDSLEDPIIAKRIEKYFEYNYPIPSYPVSYSDYNYQSTSVFYVFEYRGDIYRLTSHTAAKHAYLTGLVKLVDINLEPYPQTLGEIITTVFKYYNNYLNIMGWPTSYPEKYPISYGVIEV